MRLILQDANGVEHGENSFEGGIGAIVPSLVVKDGLYFQRTSIQDSRAVFTLLPKGSIYEITSAAAPPPVEREACMVSMAEYLRIRDERDSLKAQLLAIPATPATFGAIGGRTEAAAWQNSLSGADLTLETARARAIALEDGFREVTKVLAGYGAELEQLRKRRDELLEANNREVEKRRELEAELKCIDDDKAYLFRANVANEWNERFECQNALLGMEIEKRHIIVAHVMELRDLLDGALV